MSKTLDLLNEYIPIGTWKGPESRVRTFAPTQLGHPDIQESYYYIEVPNIANLNLNNMRATLNRLTLDRIEGDYPLRRTGRSLSSSHMQKENAFCAEPGILKIPAAVAESQGFQEVLTGRLSRNTEFLGLINEIKERSTRSSTHVAKSKKPKPDTGMVV